MVVLEGAGGEARGAAGPRAGPSSRTDAAPPEDLVGPVRAPEAKPLGDEGRDAVPPPAARRGPKREAKKRPFAT